jgi:4-hydroxy 2-oxovalerate aldolase
MSTQLTIVDTSLRDGMSSVRQQFTPSDVTAVAGGLARAGVRLLEVGHGIGIGASSIQYGHAAASDVDYVHAAVDAVEDLADVAVLYVPGISTLTVLDAVREAGAHAVRIATHCTEADCAEQPIRHARASGMRVLSFLMMSHKLAPDALAEQARKLDSYGAQVIYVVDSAGALTPAGAGQRVQALASTVEAQVGFHAHNNLGLAIGNTLAAIEHGASYVDGSLRGLGASAGNAQTEVLAVALERAGYLTGVDAFALVDLAERVIAPRMHEPQIVDETALLLGYYGLYSTFFHPAKRAADKYGLAVRDVLVELGRRQAIGGQEDMIVEVAAQMALREDTMQPSPVATGSGA